MKLSEILGWEKLDLNADRDKHVERLGKLSMPEMVCYNTALDTCDREIDREALAKEIYSQLLNYARHTVIDGFDACVVINPIAQAPKIADAIISTMPTWLRKVSEK